MFYILALVSLAAVIGGVSWLVRTYLSQNESVTTEHAADTAKTVELNQIEVRLTRLEMLARSKSYADADAREYARLISRRNELEPRPVVTPTPNPRRAYRYAHA